MKDGTFGFQETIAATNFLTHKLLLWRHVKDWHFMRWLQLWCCQMNHHLTCLDYSLTHRWTAHIQMYRHGHGTVLLWSSKLHIIHHVGSIVNSKLISWISIGFSLHTQDIPTFINLLFLLHWVSNFSKHESSIRIHVKLCSRYANKDGGMYW